MGVELHMTNGPVVEHKGALAGLLTKLGKNDILFIDEIHRLNPVVEESLYPAMEDFRIDVMTGDGAFASSIQIPIQPFTLIGAPRGPACSPRRSTRASEIIRLDFYPVEDLAKIVERSASLLGVEVAKNAALAIAARSRGTPRIANRLLRRVRDFAEVIGSGKIDERSSPSRASGSTSTAPASTRWTAAAPRHHRRLRRRSGRGRDLAPRSASLATRSRTCTSPTAPAGYLAGRPAQGGDAQGVRAPPSPVRRHGRGEAERALRRVDGFPS